MARVRVVGREEVIEAPEGTNLLKALLGANCPVSTSCGGRATCGLCRLTVVEGHQALSPVNDDEVGHLGNVAKVIHIRLACQAVITADADIVIDVPPVVDIAARKREQTRRGFAERASRRRSGPGQAQPPPDPDAPAPERIEWRPRVLEEQQQDEPRRKRRRRH